MMILCFVALVFITGARTEDQSFTTKTVHVGEDVTLTCSRQFSGSGFLFWMKLVPGNLPEVLAATFAFDGEYIENTSHITARKEPGTFVLQISQTNLKDTAFYYCEEVVKLKRRIFNVTFLRVKGPEPEITTIIEVFPSAAVRPGDSVTLQCSVLSESDHQTCRDNFSFYWFRAGSDETHPRVMYRHGDGGEKCERSPEAHLPHKCVYNFSRSPISSSDAATYYCAVVTCGQMLIGKGTKLDVEALTSDSQKITTVLFCAALAISLIFMVQVICIIKKPKRDARLTDLSSDPVYWHCRQISEGKQLYSVVVFTIIENGSDKR